MADNTIPTIPPINCDVVIVGSGFAGSLIANHLAPLMNRKKNRRMSVVILEAGPGVQPNINDYMRSFYKASIKVPESAYPPALTDAKGVLADPTLVAAGRPTGRTKWNDPRESYLDQNGSPRPFKSTYERLAGGTAHWMGLTPRLVPNDFRMKEMYDSKNVDWANWPIGYADMSPWYDKAETELGVSGDVADHSFAGLTFTPGYSFPMPRIPQSLFDKYVGEKLADLSGASLDFLGMAEPVTELTPRSQPAARNSQPYRNRRACAGNTSCIPICPIQAKYDATITLNEATNSGAKLMPRSVASNIRVEKGRVTGIEYLTYVKEVGKPAENVKGRGLVTADVYIVAANAIETPRLLLMSKNGGQTPNGVANSSRLVGCNLMDHPQYLTWGLLPVSVFPYRGPLVTSAIGDLCDGPFRKDRAAFRISLGNDAWSATVGGLAGDPHITTLDFINGVNLSSANKERAALVGPELARTLGDLISRQFRIAFAVEQSPDANNKVTLSDATDGLGLQRPKINYDLSDYTKQGILAAFRLKNVIFEKLGAKDQDFTQVDDGDAGKFQMEFVNEAGAKETATLTYGGAGHLMGTYRMGSDAGKSVVDSFGRSHDHANLFLVGSGTFPSVGTANPTITLSALALRTADHIAGKEFSTG